jgi:hypothetical protein
MGLGAFDDLEGPRTGVGGGLGGPRLLIAGIGEDPLDEREGATGLAQNLVHAIAILDVGGVDDDTQEEAERVDEDVPLAPRNFLTRVITLRVHRRPPFCAALALWLSMIAALGLTSRPSLSRTAT